MPREKQAFSSHSIRDSDIAKGKVTKRWRQFIYTFPT
jgi:hypothetical protein